MASVPSIHQDDLVKIDDSNKQLETDHYVERISMDDVLIESAIGKGSFSTVLQVRVPSWSAEDENDSSQSYALKCLTAQKTKNIEEFRLSVQDMLFETEILSRINHRNIIKLHGFSSQYPSQAIPSCDGIGYFLVLERLHETLDERLCSWRNTRNTSRHNIFKRQRDHQSQLAGLYERIEGVAMGVSHAMKYLHEQQIVYHDIKPDNIGFDSSGTVKIFDFGLARHISNDFKKGEVVGTYRYMAPEAMMGQPSGFPSDVYSFGILLWELCTLRIPFDHLKVFGREHFRKEVVDKNARPDSSVICDRLTRSLIKACWELTPDERPQFSEICSWLSDISTSLEEKLKSPQSPPLSANNRRTSLSLVSPMNLRRSLQKSESLRKMRDLLKRSDSSGSSFTGLGASQEFSTSEDFHASDSSESFWSLPF